MAHHNEVGKQGEEAACLFLIEQGLDILHRNWRMKKLEVDIIACSTQEIIFVEVKTRDEKHLLHPLAAVNRQKQLNIMRAAQAYYKIYRPSLDYRFDVLTLLRNGETYSIDHYPDAFRPTLGDLK